MKKVTMVLAMFLVFCGIAFADYPYGGVCPKGPDGKVGGYVYSKCSETDNKFPCDLWLSSKDGSYFVDTWKFAQCNCTSYAAYMLNFYGITFDNGYLGR